MRELIKEDDSLSFLRSQALDTSRCVPKLLCDVRVGSRVLDLGCGWGPLSIGLSEAGCEVVAADMTLPRLAFLSRRCMDEGIENITPICLGDRKSLPFGNEVFDLVVLNGVLEWVPESQTGHPRKLQRAFLAEVRRVLKADGQLFLGIENRYGYGYWLGQREDHTGLRYGALLPRFLANLYSTVCRRKPYRTYTYSRRGYQRLLEDTGFPVVSFYGAIPNYRQPKKFAALNNSAGLSRIFRGPVHAGHLATKLKALVGRTRLAAKVVPSFMIVASPTGNLRSSLREMAYSKIGDDAQVDWIQRSRPGLAIAGVSSGKGRFIIRVALTDTGCFRVQRNAKALEELQTMPLPAKDFIPHLVSRTMLLGRDVTFEEMAKGAAYDYWKIGGAKREQRSVDKFLNTLNGGGGTAPQNPAEWLRNWLDDIRPKLSVLAGDRLIERFYGYSLSCPELRLLRMGRVHGDFSYRNVLFDSCTKEISSVFDWDTYSPYGPTLVDPLHWEYRQRTPNALEAMSLLLDRIGLFKSRGDLCLSDTDSLKSQWWKNSLWAHLVYGLWYNTNLSKCSNRIRMDMATQVLSSVP